MILGQVIGAEFEGYFQRHTETPRYNFTMKILQYRPEADGFFIAEGSDDFGYSAINGELKENGRIWFNKSGSRGNSQMPIDEKLVNTLMNTLYVGTIVLSEDSIKLEGTYTPEEFEKEHMGTFNGVWELRLKR